MQGQTTIYVWLCNGCLREEFASNSNIIMHGHCMDIHSNAARYVHRITCFLYTKDIVESRTSFSGIDKCTLETKLIPPSTVVVILYADAENQRRFLDCTY